jgi:MICOS complex subunit MIC60
VLSTVAYGGAVWYSFKSDNFHDFFTEYVPGANQAINVIQDYDFKQRYPHATVKGKQGSQTSELGRKGPHISALEANKPEVIERKREDEERQTEQAKKKTEQEKKGKGGGKTDKEQKGATIELIPSTEAPPQTSDKAKKEPAKEPPAKRDPAGSAAPDDAKATDTKTTKGQESKDQKAKPSPTTPIPSLEQTATGPAASSARLKIDLLDIHPSDPTLEKLTTALNDLITTVNSTATYDPHSAPLYEFLKSSVADLNTKLPTLIAETRKEAESTVQAQAAYFAKLHDELQAAMAHERELIANEWMAAFDRERDALQQRYNERLNEELKKQGEVNDQRLENELLEQAISLRRRWMRELQSQVETERGGRLGKLAALEKQLSELSGLHVDSHQVFTKAEKAKKTALAVQALRDAALSRGGGFTEELAALKSLSHNDDLVRSLIPTVDPEAYTRGVASQADIAFSFQSLSNELRKIALLPPDAGVAGFAASWLLSKLMFRQKGWVRGDDVESRLARVEMLLEGGRLEDATREVNSFEGWGRELSRDWLKEARKRLEVEQAIEVCFPISFSVRWLTIRCWRRRLLWRCWRVCSLAFMTIAHLKKIENTISLSNLHNCLSH